MRVSVFDNSKEKPRFVGSFPDKAMAESFIADLVYRGADYAKKVKAGHYQIQTE